MQMFMQWDALVDFVTLALPYRHVSLVDQHELKV